MTQILIIKIVQALIFMGFHFEEKLYVKKYLYEVYFILSFYQISRRNFILVYLYC